VITPRVVPLVTVEAGAEGEIGWRCAAKVAENGMLEWADGAERTPAALRAKLRRAHARAHLRSATSLDATREALSRAERLLVANEADRALAALRSAWAERRDMRLISVAQRALAQSPAAFQALSATAAAQLGDLEQLMAARHWGPARAAFDQLLADVGTAAAAMPIGGWEPLASRISAGLALETEAATACQDAEDALRQNQPRTAVELLARFRVADLPASLALSLLRVREQAMAALLHRGEGSGEALRTVRAQRLALEQAEPDR
jgi:hypothetical protein